MVRAPERRPRASPELMAALHASKLKFHRERTQMSLREKISVILHLQRLCLPLIKRHRRLAAWEHPWTITP
jgi:hypothetical protein